MSLKKIRSLKPWLILTLFLVSWWVLPMLVKSFTRAAFFEFQAPVWEVTSRLDDMQAFWAMRNHSKAELIETSRDLARLNSAHELVLGENKMLYQEIERLESLLNLPALPEHQVILARVSRRDLDSWCHQIMIQKGAKHGISKGAAVIYRQGVVGRVREVHSYSSIIELVSSPTFRVAAHFEGDARPITYKGLSNPAFSKPKGLAANVPTDFEASANKPLCLVSSRLGGVFPDGLKIGLVKSFEPGTEGIFNCAQVELAEDLHSIKEVAILLPPNSNES